MEGKTTTKPLPALRADYGGVSPAIAGDPSFVGEGAVVLGRAVLGAGASLGAFSVIRADGNDVRIGNGFHLGAYGTVHIAHDLHPAIAGDRVTAGRGAVIHACTMGDGCVVGHGAVILDGSVVGDGAVFASDSIVFPGSKLEGGMLYSGCPAKPVSPVSPQELEAHHAEIRGAADKPDRPAGDPSGGHDCFVAPTAELRGAVSLGEGAGIWYGCRLDAGPHRITVGDGTNVQDNTVIACETAEVAIGPDVTIGHNVALRDCVVETRSLVGIGASIAPGTVVETDVLVAAGAWTEPGQRLESGKVWAGRPARPIGDMDERKRAMLDQILPHYRHYADQFRAERHDPLAGSGGG